jgi:hypothetical protein
VILAFTSTQQAAGYLSRTYGWPSDRSLRALAIARELSPSPVCRPTDEGIVTIICTGGRDYTVEDVHKKGS